MKITHFKTCFDCGVNRQQHLENKNGFQNVSWKKVNAVLCFHSYNEQSFENKLSHFSFCGLQIW